ncbi:hypothetical protein AC629_33385 [Bradyrhizobium sp. NAS80.1]|uniref:hypothetical protein n=1 Tax=Bradyrhizobium sp. NAS80.1 TaxID=1680159 RepID=UPI00096571A8|nr:hypothetical protein [Bradyrhizobium sp. NAS80.1]OKO75938.1 hypothetical protein AC629_33385 [Bradyrhizobium sp. NAS80.1]
MRPPERSVGVAPEALALFVELEGMDQHSEEFKQGSHELARMLGLVEEWWTCNHVNDRSEGPCHPPGYVARDDWYRCREVREALLQVVEARGHSA